MKNTRMALVFHSANLQWQGDLNAARCIELNKLPYGAFVYRTVMNKWFTNVLTGEMKEVDEYEVPSGYRLMALLFK